MISRLEAQKFINQTSKEDVESTAEKALERVKIMRVFDFVGVSEAVDELRTDLQAPPHHESPPKEKQRLETTRVEIPDSEEEDDDDMLFDWEPTQPLKSSRREDRSPSDDSNGKLGLLLVDNIAHVVNPLLKSNYVQGKHHFTWNINSTY